MPAIAKVGEFCDFLETCRIAWWRPNREAVQHRHRSEEIYRDTVPIRLVNVASRLGAAVLRAVPGAAFTEKVPKSACSSEFLPDLLLGIYSSIYDGNQIHRLPQTCIDRARSCPKQSQTVQCGNRAIPARTNLFAEVWSRLGAAYLTLPTETS